MKLTTTFIFLLVSLLGFSQIKPSKLSFSNNVYKIEYPKTWSLDTSKKMGSDFIVLAPLENNDDKFRENVNGIIQDLSGQNIDIEKYKQITDKQMIEIAEYCTVFESSIIKTNSNKYFKIVYTLKQGEYALKISSICTIKNDKAYLITFSSEADKYEQYKNEGESILSSFSFIK